MDEYIPLPPPNQLKKAVKRKKEAKKEAKKEVKNDYSVINTETKIFKDGRKLNIISYDAPNAPITDIFDFINRKSKLMAKSEKFRNANLNLMIKFGGGWRSFKFQQAGTVFEYLLNYEDVDDFDDTVLEFRISFII